MTDVSDIKVNDISWYSYSNFQLSIIYAIIEQDQVTMRSKERTFNTDEVNYNSVFLKEMTTLLVLKLLSV